MQDPAAPTENARTLAAYEQTAELFRSFATAQPTDALLPLLRGLVQRVPGGSVLEIGSGPGTDARWLEQHGLTVHRTDATRAFVELLRSDGYDARVLDVITDELGGPYDAVYACATLLHLPVPSLRVALRKARDAARVLAITVKEGDGEEWTSAKLGVPRWFRYWREEPLRAELAAAGWQVARLWHSPGRRDDWLQVLAT